MGGLDDFTITQEEAARILGVSSRTLRNWRRDGYGPRVIAYGRRVLYSESAIDEWIDQMSDVVSYMERKNE